MSASFSLGLFSIFDEKAAAFSPPFTARSRGEATRFFSDTVNDSKSSISQHPADYVLYALGEFEVGTGVLTPEQDGPARMFSGSDFVNPDK